MTTIQPRTATVAIYQGDYLDRIQHLERKAEAAREAAEATTRTLDEIPEYLALAEEHDKLVAEAEASAARVVVKALKRSEWKALVAEHPPREDHKGDAAVGVNEDTFKDALVAASVDLDADDLDTLSDVDFDRLYYTAFALNRAPASDPKANLVSRLTLSSDETSN